MKKTEQEKKQEPSQPQEKQPEKRIGKNFLPVVVLSLVVVGALVAVISNPLRSGNTVATIAVQGETIEIVDLEQVSTPYHVEIGSLEGQYNLILIEKGRISVSTANCPDQVCVLQGPSGAEGRPILCLPHQVIITIEGEDVPDGFS